MRSTTSVDYDNGVIALEIEWNNKDPFFDRDLENFKRLHAEGAISVGVIVTRGASLQDEMVGLVRRFADERQVTSERTCLQLGLNPTRRQQGDFERRMRAAATSPRLVAGTSSRTSTAQPPPIGASWKIGCTAASAIRARWSWSACRRP